MLKLLSGYQSKNVSGQIKLNGRVNNKSLIRQNSAYIMQEYTFHQFITVHETLMFSVNCRISKKDENFKNEKVEWCEYLIEKSFNLFFFSFNFRLRQFCASLV